MKALKIWGWMLFASSVVLFLIGLLSGEFNRYGLYGTSTVAMMLTIFSVICLVLAITVMLIILAMKTAQSEK